MSLFTASVTVNTVRLDAIRRGLRPALRESVGDVAAGMEQRARALVPVRTGALQRSIGHDFPTPTSARVFATQPYARFVEYGTRYMAAQPYLTPASEWGRANVRALIQRRLGVLIGQ
jgi:HK97 gp10 family phage protein